MNIWQNLFTGILTNRLAALVSTLLLIFNVGTPNVNKSVDLTAYTKVAFYDCFSDNTLDTTKWRQHNSQGVTLRKGGYWDMNQVSVHDGSLHIKTEYRDGAWYTGAISTQDKFSNAYGYYECSCILPEGQGLWSAFWLTCPNASKVMGSGKYGAEIDIFESPYGYLSGKNSYKVTSNIHYNGYELQTKYKNVAITQLANDPYHEFNTYGLLWTEDMYIFYVNGQEIGRTNFGGVSEQPEYLILSCEVDGAAGIPTTGWSGNINKNKCGKSFSTEFIVDYVKVLTIPESSN